MGHDSMNRKAVICKIENKYHRYRPKGLNEEFRDLLEDWNPEYDAITMLSYILRDREEMGVIYCYDINCEEGTFRCRNKQGEELKVRVEPGYSYNASSEISITKNNITSNYVCSGSKGRIKNELRLTLFIDSVVYEKDDNIIIRKYSTDRFSYIIKNKKGSFSIDIQLQKTDKDKQVCLPNEEDFIKDLCKINLSTSAFQIYNMIIGRYVFLPIKEIEIATPDEERLIINRKEDNLVEYSKSVTLPSGKKVIGKCEAKNGKEEISFTIKGVNFETSIIDAEINEFIERDFKAAVKSLKK